MSSALNKIVNSVTGHDLSNSKVQTAIGKDNPMKKLVKSLRSRRDFANKNGGAIVLSYDKGIKNANSILSKSNEDYLLVPECDDKYKEVVIHLSEDVGVEEILADNHEDFSASFNEITFFGHIGNYPPQNNKWKKIGVMRPQKGNNYYLAEFDP